MVSGSATQGGELPCGCGREAGVLPALCTTLPGCSPSHLPDSLKFKPELGWAGRATPYCPRTPGLVFSQALWNSPHHVQTPCPFGGILPILYFPKSLPSNLEQPQGFQSHLQAEDSHLQPSSDRSLLHELDIKIQCCSLGSRGRCLDGLSPQRGDFDTIPAPHTHIFEPFPVSVLPYLPQQL